MSHLFWFRADEEPVDPKKYLEEACKPKCVRPLLEYQACVKRIQGDESGHKHCTGQYFDYWSCVDKCVSCTKAVFETEVEGMCQGTSVSYRIFLNVRSCAYFTDLGQPPFILMSKHFLNKNNGTCLGFIALQLARS
ncbi:hypothetical protein POTOM_021679 [Populus tomentosa]|uniref:Complex III subunit VI n=1 Tax=Populus tomentosa TaxID=118781 RepID=A0A8X7ZSC4_POPTO|nr:hypothetical protein POTOM_021679 [Populus tomentosa]